MAGVSISLEVVYVAAVPKLGDQNMPILRSVECPKKSLLSFGIQRTLTLCAQPQQQHSVSKHSEETTKGKAECCEAVPSDRNRGKSGERDTSGNIVLRPTKVNLPSLLNR